MKSPQQYPKAPDVTLSCLISSVEKLYTQTQKIKQALNGKPLATSLKHMQDLQIEIASLKNFKLHSIQNTLIILESLLSTQIAVYEKQAVESKPFKLNRNGK
jgi:hypothetical protein